jgi:hypothetical protein
MGAMATAANKIAAERLKTISPGKESRCGAALLGKQAMPSAISAIPAKRERGTAIPSALPPNSNMFGNSGTKANSKPATISSHDAATTMSCNMVFSFKLNLMIE